MDVQSLTILVFGATGQQGGAVARALRGAGWRVRVFVRDTAGAAACALAAAGCDLIRGDLQDRHAIERAMAGVYGVFSVQPSSGQGAAHGISDAEEIRWATTIAEVAQAVGVRHLVYSSAIAAGGGPTGVGHFDSKIEIERHLKSLSVPNTIVRPSTFMEILTQPGLGLDQNILQFFMRPDQAMQFIAVMDIGRIVAAVFARPERFVAQAIPIAGDALTGDELAARLGAVSGRAIAYRRFPDALLRENSFLGALAALVDDGRLAGNADIGALRALTPGLHTFDSWLAGPGKQLLRRAVTADPAAVALR